MIHVSTAAWEYLTEVIGENYGVKVELKANGCSGFGIKTSINETGQTKNEFVHFIGHPSDLTNDTLRVIINDDQIDKFEGMTVTLEEEGLNKKVKFNLLNVGNSCGCGESFSFT